MSDIQYQQASLNASRGLFDDALRVLQSAVPETTRRPLELVLLGELLYNTSDNSGATKIAKHLASSNSLALPYRARSLTVLGMCAFDQGNIKRSARLLQDAVRLALESGDVDCTCHTILSQLAYQSDLITPTALASIVAEASLHVRRSTNIANRARLHIILGRIEGRRGLLDEADRHLSEARTILDFAPNAWLQGLQSLDASIVAHLRANLADALTLATAAVDFSQTSGHVRTRVAALSNIGSYYLHSGDLWNAEKYFHLAAALPCDANDVVASLLDGYAGLQLLTGHLDKCEAILDDIDKKLPTPRGLLPSWSKVSFLLTRIRLLQRRGHWKQSLDATDLGLTCASGRRDCLMFRIVGLLKIDTLIALDRLGDAGSVLREVEATAGRWSPSLLGELDRAKGELMVKLGRPDHGRRRLQSAARVLSAVGSADAAQRAIAALRYVSATTGSSPRQLPSLSDAAFILSLGSNSELLGREALALIANLNCARGAALVATRVGRPIEVLDHIDWSVDQARREALATDPDRRVSLGSARGRQYYLISEPTLDIVSHQAFEDVHKLIVSAVELEISRKQQQRTISILPAESVFGTESVFVSDEMLRIVAIARRIARSDLPVLITGETGTGKEVIARLIHASSGRADNLFLAFNCTGLPRDTAESQLFGHRRGAFTDAREAAPGILRTAAGGTLLLDEVGELDLSIQPKLLRFLESGEIHPVGEPKPVRVDVRVIAATNSSIESLVREGRFREDLFYRLNVVRLRVPPLRERREEIPGLAKHFIARVGREMKRGHVELSQEALAAFLEYDWPGNVRQLANEIRRVLAMADRDHTVRFSQLSPEIRLFGGRGSIWTSDQDAIDSDTCLVRLDQSLADATEQLERAMIRRAIRESGGRINVAAQLLGLSRKGLFLKRRRLGIDKERG